MARETSIDDLPEGILTTIFEFKLRTMEEMMTLSCVCKKWRSAALQTRYLSVESKYLEEPESPFTKVLLLDLLAKYTMLEDVEFDVTELDAPFLWAFLRGRDRLTRFTFEGGHLDFDSSAALFSMLMLLPKLRQLKIKGLSLNAGVLEQRRNRSFESLQQIHMSTFFISQADLDSLMSQCPSLLKLTLIQATLEVDVIEDLYIRSLLLEELEFRLARGTVELYIDTPSLKSAALGLNNYGSAVFLAHRLMSLDLHACKLITTAGSFSGVKNLTWGTAWGPKGVVSISWDSLVGLLNQMIGLEFLSLSCNNVSMGATGARAGISQFFEGLGNLTELHVEGAWFFRTLVKSTPRKEQPLKLDTLDIELPKPLPHRCISHVNWLLCSSPNLEYLTIFTEAKSQALTRLVSAYRKDHPDVQVDFELED